MAKRKKLMPGAVEVDSIWIDQAQYIHELHELLKRVEHLLRTSGHTASGRGTASWESYMKRAAKLVKEIHDILERNT